MACFPNRTRGPSRASIPLETITSQCWFVPTVLNHVSTSESIWQLYGCLLTVCLGANICVKTQFDEHYIYIPLDLIWIFLAVPTCPAGLISLVHPVGGHLVRDLRSNTCLQCNRTTTTLVLWLYSKSGLVWHESLKAADASTFGPEGPEIPGGPCNPRMPLRPWSPWEGLQHTLSD